MCLSGFGLDEHPEVWKKKLGDPRRRVILEFLVLGWTYQEQDICLKLNREPPLPIPEKGSSGVKMAKELARKAAAEKKGGKAEGSKGSGRGRGRAAKHAPSGKRQKTLDHFSTPSGKGAPAVAQNVTGDKNPAAQTGTASKKNSPLKPQSLKLTEDETREILAEALRNKQNLAS
jgi:hypothetical protein